MNKLLLPLRAFWSKSTPIKNGATSRQHTLLQQQSDASCSRLMDALRELEESASSGRPKKVSQP